MARHVIHISELEAANRFATLLSRLRAGEEIIIEDDSRAVAVVHPADPVRVATPGTGTWLDRYSGRQLR